VRTPSRGIQRSINEPLTREERARLLSYLVDEFERRGWRDDGQTAFALVRLVEDQGGEPGPSRLEQSVSSSFRVQNNAAIAEVRRALVAALRSVRPSSAPSG